MLGAININEIRSQIESDGYAVLRGFFSDQDVIAYREECERAFNEAPQRRGKYFEPGKTPNYVAPWIINKEAKQVASWRYYTFFHNPISEVAATIYDPVLTLRDEIEAGWSGVAEHLREQGLHDYNIISTYAEGAGYYPRHADMPTDLPFPMLQSQLMLSQFGADYEGGDLTLFAKDGGAVRANADLNLRVGDLLLFDKRLEHEVSQVTSNGRSGLGRWMALVGAKTTPQRPPLAQRIGSALLPKQRYSSPRGSS